jgi:Flp pilus assembly protein TadG
MSAPPRPPAPRLRGDAGAVLVETAFVAPVLLFFFMGTIEYGMFYRDYLNVSAATSDGAKYGAIQGPDPGAGGVSADYTIMKTIRNNIGTLQISSIDRIVVFQANSSASGKPLDQVPTACKTATASSTVLKCNVYRIAGVPLTASAFVQLDANNAAFFDCNTVGDAACGWPPDGVPTTRKNGPKVVDIQYLGVYIKINRAKITGVVPMPGVLEIASIQRLEPGELE